MHITAKAVFFAPGKWWATRHPLASDKYPGYKISEATWEKIRTLDSPRLKEVTMRVATGLSAAGFYGIVGASLILVGLVFSYYMVAAVGLVGFFLFMIIASAVESPKWNGRLPSWSIAVGPPFGRLLKAKPPKINEFVLEICWGELPLSLREEVVVDSRKSQVKSTSLVFWTVLVLLAFLVRVLL